MPHLIAALYRELPSKSSCPSRVRITCLPDVNPEDYLTNVLARLPSLKIHQIHELLPGQCKPPLVNTS